MILDNDFALSDINKWEIDEFPTIQLRPTNKLLPIFLEPLPDESLYSWLVRVAQKNMSSLPIMSELSLSSGLRNKMQIIDLSLPDVFLQTILDKTGLNKEKIINLTTEKWKDIFPREFSKYIFTSSSKFCPLCLNEEVFPYLKLEWRLKIIHTCSHHNCFLILKFPS